MSMSLVAVSCSESFLDVEHYGIVSPEGVYSDPENVLKGLTAVYQGFYNPSDYYIKPHYPLANLPTLDTQADGWDAPMSSHSWGVASQSNFFMIAWQYSYAHIARANLFLRDLEGVEESVVPAATKQIYEAEARAIRAYLYYFLTINFSRVPMLMTGETYQTSPNKARPESDAEAWALIKEDFEFAASVLDWQPGDGQKGRFTKGAALAYAGKVNMYLGDYERAKSQYKQVVDSKTYQLNPCYAMTSWVDNPWNVEAVWEVAFPQYPSMTNIWGYIGNNDYRHFTQQSKPREYSGWGDSFTSYELVRSFEPGDKRRTYSIAGWDGHAGKGDVNFVTGDPIGKPVAEGAAAPFRDWFLSTAEFKPNNHSMKWWRVNTQYSSHSVNLYRYGGVLLDYAECCFRTGDTGTGWQVLNELRNRAWGNLEPGTDPDASGSFLAFPKEVLNTSVVPVPDAQTVYTAYKAEKGYTSDVWMVAMIQERRKELYYEYSLYYDLIRCNMIEEWLDCEYPKNNNASFYNTATKQYVVPTPKVDENGITTIDYNQPWNDASPAERANLIPVTARNWDWNPIRKVFPIPVEELTANPLMTQNEGY